MKFYRILGLLIIFVANSTAFCSEGKLTFMVQEPKGSNLDLVSFEEKLVDFPFIIKYPAKWYVREETSGLMSGLFISREPVLKVEDQYKTGVGIYYLENYFFRTASPDSEWGKGAKSVHYVPNWDEQKNIYLTSLKEQGCVIFSAVDTMVSTYPSLKIEFQSKDSRIITYFIKKDFDLINLLLEAPVKEFAGYQKLLESIVNSFQITE
ncbi:MAG: hypothetical protein K9L86_07375 [Candidatus Omnitrophica bacterium]|nr:hypothetical protein [Candidatus Omnitrophota bacterium]